MNHPRGGVGSSSTRTANTNRRSGLIGRSRGRQQSNRSSALARASISNHTNNTTTTTTTNNNNPSSSSRRNNHGRSLRNNGTTTTNTVPAAVGTEAVAQTNMERNKREFRYPPEGFVTPIEHSLLYNMIKEPKIYPRPVIIQHILEEDYSQYMEIRQESSKRYQSSEQESTSNNNNNNNNNDAAVEDEDQKRRTALAASDVSYRQLSALIALSAENFPHTDNDNVSEVLGKTIVNFVIKYCNEHELDRSVEIQELLNPVENYAIKRNANAELQAIVPLYAGYTASLLTANPLPVLVGLTLWNKKRIESEKEIKNLQTLKDETNRRSNIETSGLLDEMDEF